jgi:hypothetical protein
MTRDVWTIIVPRPSGEDIFVAKVPKGTAANRWNAQRVINAVRAKVPIEQIDIDVVVIDGEPHEQPLVLGSAPHAETFVRSVMPHLAGYR